MVDSRSATLGASRGIYSSVSSVGAPACRKERKEGRNRDHCRKKGVTLPAPLKKPLFPAFDARHCLPSQLKVAALHVDRALISFLGASGLWSGDADLKFLLRVDG